MILVSSLGMRVVICFVFAVFSASLFGQLPKAEEAALPFDRGEKLTFRIHYGIIDAAEATLSVENDQEYNGQPTYHVKGVGKTSTVFDWFFKVRDRYESYIHEDSLTPIHHIRRVKEGSFKLSRDIDFDMENNKATVKGKQYDIPDNTQDLISAFYYARCLDFANAEVGKEFDVVTFFDYEVYPMKIKFLGREVVKTGVGKVNCLKFRPLVQEGRVFSEEEGMTIWISDDECKVPIRVKTDILVGSIKMDLKSYSGLVGDLNFVETD